MWSSSALISKSLNSVCSSFWPKITILNLTTWALSFPICMFNLFTWIKMHIIKSITSFLKNNYYSKLFYHFIHSLISSHLEICFSCLMFSSVNAAYNNSFLGSTGKICWVPYPWWGVVTFWHYIPVLQKLNTKETDNLVQLLTSSGLS